MNLGTRSQRSRITTVALATAVALTVGLGLTGCSAAKDSDTVRSLKTDVSVRSGSHKLGYQVVNNSNYTLVQRDKGGKLDNPSRTTLSPGTTATVNLTDDSSPTDQGEIDYSIWDFSNPTDGIYLGEVDVTFIDNWLHGVSTHVEYEPDVKAGLISDTGTDTSGSTSVYFTNGTCGRAYSHGVGSIDQTIYNSTPYTLNLVNDTQHTSLQGGNWGTQPPATIAPGACAEINAYTNNIVYGFGFTMNATYSFAAPNGRLYAVFSNGYSPETPDGGGIGTASAVYTSLPSLTGAGWVGNVSTAYAMVESSTSPASAEHPHTNTTLAPR